MSEQTCRLYALASIALATFSKLNVGARDVVAGNVVTVGGFGGLGEDIGHDLLQLLIHLFVLAQLRRSLSYSFPKRMVATPLKVCILPGANRIPFSGRYLADSKVVGIGACNGNAAAGNQSLHWSRFSLSGWRRAEPRRT